MKSGERTVALLGITEHIEMDLLSSADACVTAVRQEEEEEEEHSFQQNYKVEVPRTRTAPKRYLEHPLVPECEEEPVCEFQTEPRQPKPTKTKAEPPAKQETGHHTPVLKFMEDIEIEMEIFPPFKVRESDLIELKSDDSSIMIPPTPHKASRLKWKRLTPQKTGLVVKDVICLPRGQYMAQLDTHLVPRGKEREALSAMGLTARFTIDCGWSAGQMASRLVMLFQGRFIKQAGEMFSFTYLQCVQGSRVLFVPDTPAEGWTGEQVMRISGHGPLYIFSHQDCSQVETDNSMSPAVNRVFLDTSTESFQCDNSQPEKGRFTLDLDTILRRFRQENLDRDAEIHIQVRRRDLLRSALKAVRRPGFCFGKTPIVAFCGEETRGHEGPLREFFRLTLLELQQTSIFEGRPGHLFLTYDLTALEDRKYFEAGVLIGWSLAHGGPGPRCLHPALYQLMCGHGSSLEDFICTDIVDADVQIRLQQLHSCTDVKRLPPSLCDWVSSSGIPGISSASSEEIPAIYMCLVKHHIYHRVASMISQFTEGLNSCGGLWDVVQSHWEAFVPVMTSAQQQPLSLGTFKQLFTVCYSRSDGLLRAAEEATVGHWETLLNLIGDGQADFSFEDLLAFITGADHLPPLGFPRLIALRFYSQEASMSTVRLPHASTCALELFLPVGVQRVSDLLALLSRALHEALGFTRFPAKESEEERIG
ncbi:hypothetical protein Q5P01_015645 [Channa striata]|uniref:HECT domain-containing protein n=1 Tax=Channa striata TaxID=64152 RepID=A0AA88MEU9_CHASR|nr:hypothetical protein Q5P01_015645 [Channa striata]